MKHLELLLTVRKFFAFNFNIWINKTFGVACLNECFPSNMFPCADGQGPSGNKTSASTSLFHENDLTVSYSDLEKIFNSDEDDPGVS